MSETAISVLLNYLTTTLTIRPKKLTNLLQIIEIFVNSISQEHTQMHKHILSWLAQALNIKHGLRHCGGPQQMFNIGKQQWFFR